MSEFQTLTERAQDGDVLAFKEIFELLSNKLFAYALSHTKSRDDALDIVQETFIELWGALPRFSYKSDESFYGFVFIILKRRLARYYDKNSKVKQVPFDEEYVTESYEMEVEDYRHMHKFVKRLPFRYQEVLRLRYWADLPFKAIAEALDTNEQTAKVWHHRALQQLQELLGNTIYERQT